MKRYFVPKAVEVIAAAEAIKLASMLNLQEAIVERDSAITMTRYE